MSNKETLFRISVLLLCLAATIFFALREARGDSLHRGVRIENMSPFEYDPGAPGIWRVTDEKNGVICYVASLKTSDISCVALTP